VNLVNVEKEPDEDSGKERDNSGWIFLGIAVVIILAVFVVWP
jgi:hypothetical protein